MTKSPASVVTPERQTDPTARIERRSILVVVLVTLPLLVALVYWLNLSAGQRFDIGGFAQAYVDPTGRLGLADIIAQPDLFPPATGSAANLGVRSTPETAFWLRLPLATLRAAIPWQASTPHILSLEEPRFRQVDLYVVDEAGSISRQRFMRDAWTDYRFPAFVLAEKELAGDILYARITTGSSMRATLYLSSEAGFAANYGRSAVGLSVLLGLMAASAAYLLPLGMALQRSIYFSLGAAMLFAGLYVASDQALLETYLLPGAVALSRSVSLSSIVFFYSAFLSFSVRFLHIDRQGGRLRRSLDGLALALALLGIAAFVDAQADTGLLRRVLPYIGLASSAVLAGLLVISLLRTPRRAILFTILWLPLLVTGLMRIQLDTLIGQAASTMALNGIYFGLALSLLLFAVVTPLELYRWELTLRRRTQALLERLESFARLGRDIYVETDASGRVIYLAGEGSNVVLGDDDAPESMAASGLPERVQTALTAATRGRRTLRNDIVPVGDADAPRWLSLSGAFGDDAQHFRAILRDVTAEIEQENQRQQEQHLISLGSMAATVAHEINNVVQPIVNMSKGLRVHVEAAPAAGRMLDLIDLASQQAIVLVDQILKLGGSWPEPTATQRDIDLAVQDAVATLRLTLPPNLLIQAQIDAVPGISVRAGDILQILINVVTNARRALGDSGTIQIELASAPGGALLSVTDHGEGMSAGLAARVTEPHVSTKIDGRASGIGLVVVKRLVSLHGGSLTIASQPGDGTRIAMFFPADTGNLP